MSTDGPPAVAFFRSCCHLLRYLLRPWVQHDNVSNVQRLQVVNGLGVQASLDFYPLTKVIRSRLRTHVALESLHLQNISNTNTKLLILSVCLEKVHQHTINYNKGLKKIT